MRALVQPTRGAVARRVQRAAHVGAAAELVAETLTAHGVGVLTGRDSEASHERPPQRLGADAHGLGHVGEHDHAVAVVDDPGLDESAGVLDAVVGSAEFPTRAR